MWIQDLDGDLINLFHARSIAVIEEGETYAVVASFDADRISCSVVVYRSDNPDRCKMFLAALMEKLGVRAVALAR